jgi:hypothetical protein
MARTSSMASLRTAWQPVYGCNGLAEILSHQNCSTSVARPWRRRSTLCHAYRRASVTPDVTALSRVRPASRGDLSHLAVEESLKTRGVGPWGIRVASAGLSCSFRVAFEGANLRPNLRQTIAPYRLRFRELWQLPSRSVSRLCHVWCPGSVPLALSPAPAFTPLCRLWFRPPVYPRQACPL